MVPSLRYSILLFWILLPVNEAAGGIITVDDYESNTQWMFLESDTTKTFSKAVSWIAELNEKKAEGYSDWKLPSTPDSKDVGWPDDGDFKNKTNVTYSHLRHLYYTVKKYTAVTEPQQNAPISRDPFSHKYYWVGTGSTPYYSSYQTSNNQSMAWAFDFSTGLQFLQTLNFESYTLAMRTEPLPTSAVPQPNSALLFLTGILCLAYPPLARKQLK